MINGGHLKSENAAFSGEIPRWIGHMKWQFPHDFAQFFSEFKI